MNEFCETSIINNNVINNKNTYKNALNDYNIVYGKYTSSIANYNYLFEVTKCCGYKEIASVYKDGNMKDIYNIVCSQFQLNRSDDRIKLFLIDESNNKILLENSCETITSFIKMKKEYFKPIYPVPASIVYKIYIDYGGCHTHDSPCVPSICKIHSC
jgi:hypothetical protein